MRQQRRRDEWEHTLWEVGSLDRLEAEMDRLMEAFALLMEAREARDAPYGQPDLRLVAEA